MFTTSNKWSNFNGLSSLLLARYDAGIKELNVHNKSNSNILKHCTLFDAKLKRCKFNYVENNFVHEHLTIKSVPINFCSTNTCVFLGSLLPEKGKINLEKCFRLNVPRNLVSELENGNSIINKEGKTIHPSDVCFPDRPEQNFMIFECLDPEYLNYLFNNGTIKQFLSRFVLLLILTPLSFIYLDVIQLFILPTTNLCPTKIIKNLSTNTILFTIFSSQKRIEHSVFILLIDFKFN